MAARLRTFTNDGLSFDVIDDGPLGGTPVVLLHGFPQTALQWSRVTPYLHEQGYRTIAPTQRGYSPGARPRGRFAYRMTALVSDTTALIYALGGKPVHLVGHDWGSAVAWSAAAAHPDLVRSLTSVSVPHPMAFMRSTVTSRQGLRSFYMLAFQVPWLPEAIISRVFRASSASNPDLYRRALASSRMDREQFDRIQRDVIDSGALAYAIHWYRAMLIVNPLHAMQKVSAPTTHVWSTRDGLMSRTGADLTTEYVTGPFRLEVLDATHWVPEERPAELAAIIAARAEQRG